MNFLARETKPAAMFQMTAMVDIVFILLAFFVMASQFNMPEKDFPAGAGERSLAAGAAAQDFPAEIPVRVARTAAGVSIAVGQDVNVADLAALQAKLTEINMPEITVRLLADPELTVDEVAAALDAVLASPMKKVSLAALRKSGGAGR